jgi:hypothetical protein
VAWKTCKNCGVKFRGNGKHYCTWECFCQAAGNHKPDAATLHWLVWSLPTYRIARMYKVSDTAVAKWCKKLGVKKPPRGYWAKVHAGLLKRREPMKGVTAEATLEIRDHCVSDTMSEKQLLHFNQVGGSYTLVEKKE